MPQIETRSRLPPAIRDHLADRMLDRKISLDDLNQLGLWISASRKARYSGVVLGFTFRVNTMYDFSPCCSALLQSTKITA